MNIMESDNNLISYKIIFIYFLLGVILDFPMLPLRVHYVSLDISPSRLDYIVSTVMIPWVIKPIYGLISDNFPIRGKRRKPYIFLMNTCMILFWPIFLMFNKEINVSIIILFLIQLFLCFTDVMYDSILVETSKNEKKGSHGKLQSWCWTMKAIGSTLSSLVSGFLLKGLSLKYIITILISIICIINLFCMIFIKESKVIVQIENRKGLVVVKNGLLQEIRKIINIMKNPSMYKPALFVFTLSCTPSSSTPFFFYLVEKLGFSTSSLGVISSASHASMALGAFLYGRFFRNVPFRKFFFIMVILSTMLSFTPIIVVKQWNENVGIPNFWFTLGDDVFLSTIGEICLMPCLILVAKLCPYGVEATIYATFVSILNISSIISGYLGAIASNYFGVSKQNFDNLPNLIIFCSLTSLIPLLFISFLPEGNAENIIEKTKIIGPRIEKYDNIIQMNIINKSDEVDNVSLNTEDINAVACKI